MNKMNAIDLCQISTLFQYHMISKDCLNNITLFLMQDLSEKSNSFGTSITKIAFLDYFNGPLLLKERIYHMIYGRELNISASDFIHKTQILLTCSQSDLLQYIFSLFDFNNDEYITANDINLLWENVIIFHLSTNNLKDKKSLIIASQRKTWGDIIKQPISYAIFRRFITTSNSDFFIAIYYYFNRIISDIFATVKTIQMGNISIMPEWKIMLLAKHNEVYIKCFTNNNFRASNMTQLANFNSKSNIIQTHLHDNYPSTKGNSNKMILGKSIKGKYEFPKALSMQPGLYEKENDYTEDFNQEKTIELIMTKKHKIKLSRNINICPFTKSNHTLNIQAENTFNDNNNTLKENNSSDDNDSDNNEYSVKIKEDKDYYKTPINPIKQKPKISINLKKSIDNTNTQIEKKMHQFNKYKMNNVIVKHSNPQTLFERHNNQTILHSKTINSKIHSNLTNQIPLITLSPLNITKFPYVEEEKKCDFKGIIFKKNNQNEMKKYSFELINNHIYLLSFKNENIQKGVIKLINCNYMKDMIIIQYPKQCLYSFKLYHNLNYITYYFESKIDFKNFNELLEERLFNENNSDILKKYKVKNEIARGKYSVLYLCQDHSNHDFVLKTIKKETLQPLDYEAIKNEINIMRLCHQRDIVKLIEYGENHEYFYLIIEYFNCKDLHSYINEKKIPLNQRTIQQIAKDLIEVLQYIHSKGIIHRDIKGENILFNGIDNSIKLIDFGLSRILGEKEKIEGESFGTLGYAAPEILLGESYDFSIDVFSFGVLIYYLMFNKKPFEGDIETLIYKKTISCKIQYPKVTNDSPEDKLIKMLKKILKRNPNNRLTLDQIKNDEWMKMSIPYV